MTTNLNKFNYGELSKSTWGHQTSELASLGVRRMENMHTSVTGSARKRNGSLFIKSYDQEVRAIKLQDHVIVILDTNEYEIVKWEEQGNTLQAKQSMPAGFDFTKFDTSKVKHTEYNNKFIIGQDDGKIFSYDYTTKAFTLISFTGTGAKPPNANIFTYYNSRSVYAKDDTLYFSTYEQPYDFTVTSSTALATDSYSIKIADITKSKILDIISYKDFLIIGTEEYIYTLSGGKIAPTVTNTQVDRIQVSRVRSLGMKIKSFRIVKDILICIGASGIFSLRVVFGEIEQQDLTKHCRHLFENQEYKKISKYYAHDDMFFTLRTTGEIIAFSLVSISGQGYIASGSRYNTENGIFIDFDVYSNTNVTKYGSKYFVNKFIEFNYTSDNEFIRNVTDDEKALKYYNFYDSCITSKFTNYNYATAIATHKIKFNSSQLNFSKNDYVYIKYTALETNYIKSHIETEQIYTTEKYKYQYIKIINNVVNDELIISDISFILNSEVIILGKKQDIVDDATLTSIYGNESKYNLCMTYINMNNGGIPFLDTIPLIANENNEIIANPNSWFYIIGLCYHSSLDLIPYSSILGSKQREVDIITLYANKLPFLKLIMHEGFESLIAKEPKKSSIKLFDNVNNIARPYTSHHIKHIGGNNKWDSDFNVSFIIPAGYSGEIEFINYIT